MPTYLTENLAFDLTTGCARHGRDGADRWASPSLSAPVRPHGRRRIVLTGCLGLLVLSLPSFLLIQQRTTGAILAGLPALGLVLDCFTGTMPAILPALFPTRVRYGALSIRFNAAVGLLGGTTPLIVAGLVTATGKHPLACGLPHRGGGGGCGRLLHAGDRRTLAEGVDPDRDEPRRGAPGGGGGLASGESGGGGRLVGARSAGRAAWMRRFARACERRPVPEGRRGSVPARGLGCGWRSARRATGRQPGARGRED